MYLHLISHDFGHMCYILQSINYPSKIYIGYTVDINHRIKQHNGLLVGGAKKTKKYLPWKIVCVIRGFYEPSSALRFEYRLQKLSKRKDLKYTLTQLEYLINNGDGSVKMNNKIPWVKLWILWYIDYKINSVSNTYIY